MRLSVDFFRLHATVRQMGADELDTGFCLAHEANALDSIDIGLIGGVEVTLDDVDVETGLLAYNGRQVLLYIQDHGANVQAVLDDGSQGRKYHVAFCSTLDSMRTKGRFERYVATNDLSGEFHISGKDFYAPIPIEGKARLKVCKNCLRHLNYQGYQQGRKGDIFARFSLEDFFATYSSFFPHMPSRLAGENDSLYTKDWPIVSGNYKANRQFRCESCGVDLSDHRRLLHVHHKNGVKTDNGVANLEALCADCHRKQPSHGGMYVSHDDMRRITQLRRDQAGRKLGSDWNEVFELADTAVHGILHACRKKGMILPEVGYEIQHADGRILGQLELAWPRKKLGVAVSTDDLDLARGQGWKAWSMLDALEHLR